MKKILFILLLGLVFVASTAQAASTTAGPLTISYVGTGALFSGTNIYPDQSVSKDVTVKNNGTVSHHFAIATKNVSGVLAKQIQITPSVSGIDQWTTSVYDLSVLTGQSKSVVLIAAGATKIVNIKAHFSPSTGNGTQNTSTSFDFVFGTEESEPVVGGLSALTAPSPTASVSETPSVTVTTSPEGEVKGEETSQNENGVNPWFLLIVPAAVLASFVFLPEFAFAGGAAAVSGGASLVLGYSFKGGMDPVIFYIILGAEVLALIIISYFMLHHDNRASRRIRGYHHRLRIR